MNFNWLGCEAVERENMQRQGASNNKVAVMAVSSGSRIRECSLALHATDYSPPYSDIAQETAIFMSRSSLGGNVFPGFCFDMKHQPSAESPAGDERFEGLVLGGQS